MTHRREEKRWVKGTGGVPSKSEEVGLAQGVEIEREKPEAGGERVGMAGGGEEQVALRAWKGEVTKKMRGVLGGAETEGVGKKGFGKISW